MDKSLYMRQLRIGLNLSLTEFAQLIGLHTPNGSDMVRKFESGKSDISGVTFNLLKHIDAINKIAQISDDINIYKIIKELQE